MMHGSTITMKRIDHDISVSSNSSSLPSGNKMVFRNTLLTTSFNDSRAPRSNNAEYR